MIIPIIINFYATGVLRRTKSLDKLCYYAHLCSSPLFGVGWGTHLGTEPTYGPAYTTQALYHYATSIMSLFTFYFETRSHYIAQVGLESTLHPTMTLNL